MILQPKIDWNLCQVCSPCEVRKVCNVRAIVQIDLDEPAYIDHTRCNGCGLCITACPHEAISMQNNIHRVKRR